MGLQPRIPKLTSTQIISHKIDVEYNFAHKYSQQNLCNRWEWIARELNGFEVLNKVYVSRVFEMKS